MKKVLLKIKKIQWYLGVMMAIACFGYARYVNDYSDNPRIKAEMVSMMDGGNFKRVPLLEVSSPGSRVLHLTKYGKEFVNYAPGSWKDDFILDIVAFKDIIDNHNTAIDIYTACINKEYKKLSNYKLLMARETIRGQVQRYWAPVTKEECQRFVDLMNYRHFIYDDDDAVSMWWVLFWLLILPVSIKTILFLDKKMNE